MEYPKSFFRIFYKFIKYSFKILNQMEKLPKDLLSYMIVDLDIDTISRLCRTSSKINKDVCLNSTFWRNKLLKDFPHIDISGVKNKDTINLYKYLVSKPDVYYIKNYYRDFYASGNYVSFKKLLNDYVIKNNLKKGDVIIFEDNNQKYIWNGSYFTLLGEIYFLLPSELPFPEFPPYYWKDFVQSEAMYIPSEKIKEAINNIEDNSTYIIGNYGEKYSLIFEDNLVYSLTYNRKDKSLKEYLEEHDIDDMPDRYADFKDYYINF